MVSVPSQRWSERYLLLLLFCKFCCHFTARQVDFSREVTVSGSSSALWNLIPLLWCAMSDLTISLSRPQFQDGKCGCKQPVVILMLMLNDTGDEVRGVVYFRCPGKKMLVSHSLLCGNRLTYPLKFAGAVTITFVVSEKVSFVGLDNQYHLEKHEVSLLVASHTYLHLAATSQRTTRSSECRVPGPWVNTFVGLQLCHPTRFSSLHAS